MRQFQAIVLLGWHLLKHVTKKVTFLYDPGGVTAFRAAFDEDGLGSLSPQEAEQLDEWRRCIGCGLCEAVTPELGFIPAQRRRGPAYLALCASRDLSEFEWAASVADTVESLDRTQLRNICPVDIDLVRLAEFVAERA